MLIKQQHKCVPLVTVTSLVVLVKTLWIASMTQDINVQKIETKVPQTIYVQNVPKVTQLHSDQRNALTVVVNISSG